MDRASTAAVVGADAGTFVGNVDSARARAGARASDQREQVLRGAWARGHPADCDCDCGGAATSTKCAVGWTAAVNGAGAGTCASPCARASTRARARTRTSASAGASCCAGPGMAGGASSGICLSTTARRTPFPAEAAGAPVHVASDGTASATAAAAAAPAPASGQPVAARCHSKCHLCWSTGTGSVADGINSDAAVGWRASSTAVCGVRRLRADSSRSWAASCGGSCSPLLLRS